MISLVALPHGTRTTEGAGSRDRRRLAAILADKGFLLVLAAILAGGLVYAQAYSTFPLWVRDLGFPERVYGFLQGGNGLLVASSSSAVTAIAMRYPRIRMIALGVLLTGLGFGGVRHPPDRPRDGARGHRLELRRDVRLSELGGVHRGPGAGAPARAVSERLGITYALAFTIGPIGGTAIYGWWPTGLWIACAALGLIGAALGARG